MQGATILLSHLARVADEVNQAQDIAEALVSSLRSIHTEEEPRQNHIQKMDKRVFDLEVPSSLACALAYIRCRLEPEMHWAFSLVGSKRTRG